MKYLRSQDNNAHKSIRLRQIHWTSRSRIPYVPENNYFIDRCYTAIPKIDQSTAQINADIDAITESKRKMDEEIHWEKARQGTIEEEYHVLIEHQHINFKALTDYKNQSELF